jgi:hypothetical protein
MPQCAAEDTARVGGRGAAPKAQPPTSGGRRRGVHPRGQAPGVAAGDASSQELLFSRAFKAETTGALQAAGSLGERWAESVRGVVASSWWLESVRVESVLDGILAVLA